MGGGAGGCALPSSEALAQLVRPEREGLTLSPSVAPGLCGNPSPSRGGAIHLSLTLLEVGVGASEGMIEGIPLSIQMLSQKEKGTPLWGLSLGVGKVTCWPHWPDS